MEILDMQQSRKVGYVVKWKQQELTFFTVLMLVEDLRLL